MRTLALPLLALTAWLSGCGFPADLECDSSSDCAEMELCLIPIEEAEEIFGQDGDELCSRASAGRCVPYRDALGCFCAVGDNSQLFGEAADLDSGDAISACNNLI